MGKSGRPDSHKYYDNGTKAQLSRPSSSVAHTRQTSGGHRKKLKSAPTIYSNIFRKRYHKRDRDSPRALLFKYVHSSQERRKSPSYNKLKNSKSVLKRTKIQNGNSCPSKQMYHPKPMGSNNRLEGRLLF